MLCMLLFKFANYVFLLVCYIFLFLRLCILIVMFRYIIDMYVPFWVLCFIVLFCVLFLWKCVLYYCHRVSTQMLFLNISYHISNSSICYLSFKFSYQNTTHFPSLPYASHPPPTSSSLFYHCKNVWWWLGITVRNYAVYSTCRSLVHIITKFEISLHATVYWYGRIWYKATFRISSGNLSLQNVAVCDVDVQKGENAVRELQTE